MEPVVLPAAFPNLLVNGGTGIAVGMATNLARIISTEVIDGICAQIDKPEITVAELVKKYIKGPDFPTGCTLIGMEGIKQLYRNGPRQREACARSSTLKTPRAARTRSSSRKSPLT